MATEGEVIDDPELRAAVEGPYLALGSNVELSGRAAAALRPLRAGAQGSRADRDGTGSDRHGELG